MNAISLDLPDQLTADVDKAVAAGWFTDRQEAIRQAVREFINSRRLELQESQQLDDIAWALRASKS
ncbi:hypothetical protein LBMAG52_27110 [Planctomycetia bacterium]|nr:hypothetical protein LBMAG52_27110 [Planctomycetia bacterium]